MIHLLFIDDDPKAQKTLKMVLSESYVVHSALTARAGMNLFKEIDPHVILLDINLPDRDGLELLEEILSLPTAPPVIMLTAYPDIEFVKRALQTGAYDYILKPYELEKLEGTIRRAVQNINTRKEFVKDETEALKQMIGESRAAGELKAQLIQYGSTDSPVLIQGESGTGKELAARALHQLSHRKNGPFVPINCGAIPESLLETELFGSERGAYTDAVSRPGCFEQANGGTIFLDEIGEMTMYAQVKLLRILDSKELVRVGGTNPIPLNIRVLSATNRELRQRIQDGRFREDLYYRVRVLPVTIPPLRERRDDIPLLTACFLKSLGDGKCINQAASKKLMDYEWPGNIRELRNVIERALVLSQSKKIQARDIRFN